MADKPRHASEYKSEQVELVRATCLHVATKLGDLMDDLVIVGRLVPPLIVDQAALSKDSDAHVGTMDLDVGLQLALLDEGRYRKLTERLRDAGFMMDKNDEGNPTLQRWAFTNSGTVTVNFLIPPSREGDRAGRLRDIEPDLAAIIAPGIRCAFRDRQRVTIEGRTLLVGFVTDLIRAQRNKGSDDGEEPGRWHERIRSCCEDWQLQLAVGPLPNRGQTDREPFGGGRCTRRWHGNCGIVRRPHRRRGVDRTRRRFLVRRHAPRSAGAPPGAQTRGRPVAISLLGLRLF